MLILKFYILFTNYERFNAENILNIKPVILAHISFAKAQHILPEIYYSPFSNRKLQKIMAYLINDKEEILPRELF